MLRVSRRPPSASWCRRARHRPVERDDPGLPRSDRDPPGRRPADRRAGSPTTSARSSGTGSSGRSRRAPTSTRDRVMPVEVESVTAPRRAGRRRHVSEGGLIDDHPRRRPGRRDLRRAHLHARLPRGGALNAFLIMTSSTGTRWPGVAGPDRVRPDRGGRARIDLPGHVLPGLSGSDRAVRSVDRHRLRGPPPRSPPRWNCLRGRLQRCDRAPEGRRAGPRPMRGALVGGAAPLNAGTVGVAAAVAVGLGVLLFRWHGPERAATGATWAPRSIRFGNAVRAW